MGVRLEEVFSEISPQSIAAASLGQVYKATLKDGGDTGAVKVQRPNVSETVALDLYIIKRIAVVLRKYAKVNSDLGAIVDEWNRSIQGELDYLKEAANGEKFRELYGEFPGKLCLPHLPERHGILLEDLGCLCVGDTILPRGQGTEDVQRLIIEESTDNGMGRWGASWTSRSWR